MGNSSKFCCKNPTNNADKELSNDDITPRSNLSNEDNKIKLISPYFKKFTFESYLKKVINKYLYL